MRLWTLVNRGHALWRWGGLGVVAATLGLTFLYIHRGPRPLKPRTGGRLDVFNGPGSTGSFGTLTEQLGQGRFILSYERIQGTRSDLSLQGVKGRLEEPATLWLMDSPGARRQSEIWILDGPLQVRAQDSAGASLGQGSIPGAEPALQWDHGVWKGLSTLTWEDPQGQGKGVWTLPPGWVRSVDGRFQVEQGPIRWEAAQAGALRSMEAQRGWVTLGFREGRLEGIQALMEDGRLGAASADISPEAVRWGGPLDFQRQDGWEGVAREGVAPRPPQGQPLERVELAQVQARRQGPQGPERLEARGARWTPEGLRLEGDVRWEQIMDGQLLRLQAPRVLMRQAAGTRDLPADLPLRESRAEGQALLSWGNRRLGSPRLEVRPDRRSWRLQAPVLGRSEEGTFSAGMGSGSPAGWSFQGPIQAQFHDGTLLRGRNLVWEADTWTFTGQPATLTRLRERLSGPLVRRKGRDLEFPGGLYGSLAAQDGDLQVRAEKGRRSGQELLLSGRVECMGQGWSLRADRISVTLGPGNMVKRVGANGNVTLRGSLGEGQGETLDLEPATRRARWQGRVRGLAELKP